MCREGRAERVQIRQTGHDVGILPEPASVMDGIVTREAKLGGKGGGDRGGLSVGVVVGAKGGVGKRSEGGESKSG